MRQRERAYVRSLEEIAQMKSDFINVTSHELRTPISIIRGFHELMLQQSMGPLTEQQRVALTGMEQGLVTLHRIADDATRIAQIESERLVLTRAPVEPGQIVSQAIDSALADARGRSVVVTAEIQPAIGRVPVDGPRLTEAIANLVRNAIRFTPDGGRVRVAAAVRNDCLAIEVEDNGIGIAPDRQRALFERVVFAGDSLHHHSSRALEFNSAGLGLGLPIARGIVEAHGGAIRLESEVGRGSRFVVEIPVRVAEEMAA
jgi:signal transduction histidine kinase